MSDKEEAKRLREARRFARGLFWNVRGDAGRDYVDRADFDAFFDDRDVADQVSGGGRPAWLMRLFCCGDPNEAYVALRPRPHNRPAPRARAKAPPTHTPHTHSHRPLPTSTRTLTAC